MGTHLDFSQMQNQAVIVHFVQTSNAVASAPVRAKLIGHSNLGLWLEYISAATQGTTTDRFTKRFYPWSVIQAVDLDGEGQSQTRVA